LHQFVAFLACGPISWRLQRLRPYSLDPKTTAEHLFKRRNELNLFSKEVAVRMGVNEWTYIGWEKGYTTPRTSFWPKVIEFLGYNPDPEPQTIGERITYCRRARGIDHRTLAAALKIDDGTLLRYERGEWLPKGDRLKRIASFCRDDT
jgi:DNA-binding transcriptional regulator YiaG